MCIGCLCLKAQSVEDIVVDFVGQVTDLRLRIEARGYETRTVDIDCSMIEEFQSTIPFSRCFFALTPKKDANR